MQQIQQIYGDYQLGEFLGKGQYGNVYDCGHMKQPSLNGKLCIKILNKRSGKYNQYIQKLIDREVDLMKKIKNVQNQNLVQIFDFIDTNQEFALVMEKCGGGDLENHLRNNQLPFQIAHNFIGQLINGYFDLYQLNIIHRDLKPANILLSSDYKTIKITDFGMGRVLEDLKTQQKLSSVGTPAYSSPQIYFKFDYSAKCDIYSLGALFYQILFNQMICGAISSHGQLRQFIYTMESKPFKVPNKPEIPQYMKTMIEQMLAYREEDRLDFPQLYTSYHKYFNLPPKIFEIINTNSTQCSNSSNNSSVKYDEKNQGQQQQQTQQNQNSNQQFVSFQNNQVSNFNVQQNNQMNNFTCVPQQQPQQKTNENQQMKNVMSVSQQPQQKTNENQQMKNIMSVSQQHQQKINENQQMNNFQFVPQQQPQQKPNENQQNNQFSCFQVISDKYLGITAERNPQMIQSQQTPLWVKNIQKLIEYLMGCVEFVSDAAAQIKQHSHLTGMDPNTQFYLLASMYGFIYTAVLNVYGLRNSQPQFICQSITQALGNDSTEKLKFLSSEKFEQSQIISQWLQKFSGQSYNDYQFYVQNLSSYNLYNVDTLKQLLLNPNPIDFEIFLQWSNYIFKTFAKKSFQYQQQYSIHLDYVKFIYVFFKSSQLNDTYPLTTFKDFTKEALLAYQNYSLSQIQQELITLLQ